MNEDVITSFLCCPACRQGALSVEVLERDHRAIRHAVVACGRCASWYRLEDGLLELLVPSLRSTAVDEAFRRRFSLDVGTGTGPPPEDPVEHGHKLGQKSFYDEDAHSYEEHMMRLPCWRAFDSTFIDAIRSVNDRRGVMLEVGGGSGRLSILLRSDFDRILSFDLSESIVRRAMKRLGDAGGDGANVHYFVADAENIPVRDDVADVAILSGILHHVSHPERVIAETVRALKPGGRFIGVENNRTAFRPVFNLLMRLSRLWNEKAHPEHFLISERELRRWFAEAGVSGEVWTSVFLPPHVFNLLGAEGATRWLRATDGFARHIPWLAREGGLVVFCSSEVARGSAAAALALRSARG